MATLMLLGIPLNQAKAVQRCVTGVTGWWDGREEENDDEDPFPDHDYPGFRLKTCDPEVKACYPTAANCCFTALHGLQLQMLNSATSSLVASATSDSALGVFTLCDPNWVIGNQYSISVRFTHGASYPAQFGIKGTTGSGTYAFTVPIGQLTASPTVLGVLSPNHPGVAGQNPPDLGDLSSIWWGISQIWNGAWLTFATLDSLGEQRIRSTSGVGFTQIDIRTWTTDSDETHCDTSTVFVNPSHNATSHELGHILHGRIVGCNGAFPAFPDVGPFVPHCPFRTAEGVTLVESLGDLTSTLISWDPAVASTFNVVDKSWVCDPNIFNENDTLDRFRTSMGLWDLMDSDSGYTDSWSDTSVVSVSAIYDALIALRNAPGTGNHSGGEQQFVDQGTNCSAYAGGCSAPTLSCTVAGQICSVNGDCIGGDPHGANLADLVYWLPGSYDAHWKTIESGTCIRSSDDSAPFAGGYRKL